MKFWYTVSNCFHYAGNMEQAFPTALNWTDVETVARLSKIRLNKVFMRKLKLAEELTLREWQERRAKRG